MRRDRENHPGVQFAVRFCTTTKSTRGSFSGPGREPHEPNRNWIYRLALSRFRLPRLLSHNRDLYRPSPSSCRKYNGFVLSIVAWKTGPGEPRDRIPSKHGRRSREDTFRVKRRTGTLTLPIKKYIFFTFLQTFSCRTKILNFLRKSSNLYF